MASSLPRILATFLVAAYAAAAALPCGGDLAAAARIARPSDGGEHAGHPGHATPAASHPGNAAGQVHAMGHGDHAGHATAHASPAPEPAESEPPIAEWAAPCPCGCDDGPGGATGNSPRIGWALAQLRPALVGSSLSSALALPAPGAPLGPVLPLDPVPI